MRPRREVAAFARLMERELRANDHKGGWKAWQTVSALVRLREETDELATALLRNESPSVIGEEAADIANFAMMIADMAGALREDAPHDHQR